MSSPPIHIYLVADGSLIRRWLVATSYQPVSRNDTLDYSWSIRLIAETIRHWLSGPKKDKSQPMSSKYANRHDNYRLADDADDQLVADEIHLIDQSDSSVDSFIVADDEFIVADDATISQSSLSGSDESSDSDSDSDC